MKKTILLFLLIVAPSVMFAQLTVFSNGSNNVSIKTTVENPYAYLMVSPSTYTGFSSYSIGTLSGTYITQSFNVGLYSAAQSNTPTNSGRSFGIFGIAGNATSGYNYGVYGRLNGTQNGGAIVGSLSSQMGIYVPGLYAGYFDGETKVNGSLYATSVINTSDIRLKENIINFSDMEDGRTTLANVEKMNVIEYNFKVQKDIPEAERDTLTDMTIYDKPDLDLERHYGFSAQELQAIYPNLVKEGQDGYLGVNYIELIPILIRSIQALKQELDNMKLQFYATNNKSSNPDNCDNKSQQSYVLSGQRAGVNKSQLLLTSSGRKIQMK